MVSSETLFSRLVGIDALLSLEGIIPSAADFQLKLITLIEQLNKALFTEGHSANESESLCLILCHYFDQRLITDESHSHLGWQRYSLVNYFYGYTEKILPLCSRLEQLLNADSETIFRYAWSVLILLSQTKDPAERLTALRTAGHERYYSRHCSQLNPQEELTSRSISPLDESEPQLMVFIIGPFAAKWFRKSDLSSSSGNAIVWIVAEHTSILVDRLNYLNKNHRSIPTVAFFPILTDGFENSAILTEQLSAWSHAFSSAQLTESLPCLLGIYSRLSQQHNSHDPDQAVWICSQPSGSAPASRVESSLRSLKNKLSACDKGMDPDAIYRHALGDMLIAWLTDARIMNELKNVFERTRLELVGVSLADYGTGATCHGAWARWLAEKYTILPGLSASLVMPPLPTIPMQRFIKAEAEPQRPSLPVIPQPRRRWPSFAILLALIAGITIAGFYYAKQNSDAVPVLPSTPASDSEASLFASSGETPLFGKGSSELIPDSEKVLFQLLPKIVRVPQQRFLIIGHSDNTGTAEINQSISIERARVIQQWLIKHTGLPASNFIIEGAGNSRPVASNETQEGRAQNRRVEIIPLPEQINKE